ncbi:MAG: hypothetical protein ACRED1_09260 [Limisphaerales bacterium]
MMAQVAGFGPLALPKTPLAVEEEGSSIKCLTGAGRYQFAETPLDSKTGRVGDNLGSLPPQTLIAPSFY